MLLKAKEDDIYTMMDRRDLYILGSGLLVIAAGIAGYLFARCIRWDFLYLSIACFLGIFFFVFRALHINRRIMEANQCYMKIEKDCLVVFQPEKNGHYESCRIFFDEMEKIVEGSRRGVPEFYIVVKNDEERRSFILLDDEEEERLIFCVRSLGYKLDEFREFYRKLRWEVPGRVRIIGTKRQETWSLKQSHAGLCITVGLAMAYMIPKIIEVMGFF